METAERGVVFEFCNSRQGQHAAMLLQGFQGSLVCDDYAGYKALFKQQKINEAGCWAHARRKWISRSEINSDRPKMHHLLQEFKAWLLTQRQQLMNSDVTAKAMDYLLRRWVAFTIHLSDARIPIDNNAVENAIRPLAPGAQELAVCRQPASR